MSIVNLQKACFTWPCKKLHLLKVKSLQKNSLIAVLTTYKKYVLGTYVILFHSVKKKPAFVKKIAIQQKQRKKIIVAKMRKCRVLHTFTITQCVLNSMSP